MLYASMFFALKLSDYLGWRYEIYTSEKEAIEHFFSHQNHKTLVSDRVQLFKMTHANCKNKYPIFIPVEKYQWDSRTQKYKWVEIKKDYNKEIKTCY